jgi:hypothetical protein
MKKRLSVLVLSSLLAALPGMAADTLEPSEIVERMLAAAGAEGFSEIGILKLEIVEEETRNDGTRSGKEYTLYVDTSNLENMRMEIQGGATVACSPEGCWAVRDGKLDDRQQTPYMAKTTLNQSLFPIMLPFTVKMEGVWVKEAKEIQWEGREAWSLAVPFAKGFFVSPVLTTTWSLVVAKDDYSLLAASFVPPVEYRKVELKGIRYRTLKTEIIEDAQIPTQILSIGINVNGMESGHVRVTKVKPSVYGPSDPTMFRNPQTAK